MPAPTVFVPLGSGGLIRPEGLAFGPDCNLYVNDFSTNQVMRYNGVTGAPLPSTGNSGAVFVSSQSGGLGTPHGLTFGADGLLYVSSMGTTNAVLRYDGVTGAFHSNFTGTPPVNARGLTFGPTGDLYVTSKHDVHRYTSGGTYLGIFASDPGAITHYDMKFGPGGKLYVTATQTNKILSFDGTTGAALSDFVTSGLGGLSNPHGMAFGPDGNLYVSSAESHRVLRYSPTGAFIDVFASGGGLIAPGYLVFGP